MAYGVWHIGRSWNGSSIEHNCPCGKAACGLVDTQSINPNCPEHSWGAGKTIRQSHSDVTCTAGLQPGRPVQIFPSERQPFGNYEFPHADELPAQPR